MWNDFSTAMFSDFSQASNNRVRGFGGGFFSSSVSMTGSCQWALCYRQLGNCWTVTLVDPSVKFNNLHPWSYANFPLQAALRAKGSPRPEEGRDVMSPMPCRLKQSPPQKKKIKNLQNPSMTSCSWATFHDLMVSEIVWGTDLKVLSGKLVIWALLNKTDWWAWYFLKMVSQYSCLFSSCETKYCQF